MKANFFDYNDYFIDEKIQFLKFENSYRIFDNKGESIGSVRQILNFGQKILRLFVGKPMLPFMLEIRDSDEMLQVSVERGWTLFFSKISVLNSQGVKIGSIKQKFKFFKHNFNILDNFDNQIAEISGDWKAWEFVIKDNSGAEIGTISKKWAGAVREIFTTADKYHVSINPNFSNVANKTVILAAAITVDMVLKESK